MLFTESSAFTPSAQPFVPSQHAFADFATGKEFKPFTPSSDAPFPSTASFTPF